MAEPAENTPADAEEAIVIVRTPKLIKVGARFLFPYSVDVATGEPSEYRRFHEKYCNQTCEVVGLFPGREVKIATFAHHTQTRARVRFDDGFEREADLTIGYIFLSNP